MQRFMEIWPKSMSSAGVDIGAQIRDLRRGMDVVVGTPGRVIDLINRGVLNMGEVRPSLKLAEGFILALLTGM